MGALTVATVGCSDGPTSPTFGPALTCPASVVVQSPGGVSKQVSYPAPTAISTASPVTTTCAPASGTVFPVGTTNVTCTGVDTRAQTGTCTFSVVVTSTAFPTLAATRFVAFGNSITEGKVASGLTPKPYPGTLQTLLAARYTSQSIVVINEGCGGEQASAASPCSSSGAARLSSVLTLDHPQAVLIEEGVNDISFSGAAGIAPMIDALRSMIKDAKSRGITVFLTTLLPARAGGTPLPRGQAALPFIPAANTAIRALAASEGVVLVDLFVGFGGSPDPFIDTDGLHPTVPGHDLIASLFFDAIRSNLELVSGIVDNRDNRRLDPDVWLMARR